MNLILKKILKTIFIDTFLFVVWVFDCIPEFFLSQKERENRKKKKSVLVSKKRRRKG